MRLLLLVAAVPAALLAGDALVIEQTRADLRRGVEHRQTIWVEPERAAVRTQHQGRPVRYVFLASTGTLLLIEEDRKVYRELSGSDLKTLAKQNRTWVTEVEKQMREREKNLPPEQRALLEAMKRGEAGGLGAAGREQEAFPVQYERDGRADEVDGRTCERRFGTETGRRVAEVCSTPWSEFGVGEEELTPAAELARLLSERPPGTTATIAIAGSDWKKLGLFPGAPIERIEYVDGAQTSRITLESVERRPVGEQPFTVGPEYEKRYVLGL